MSDDSIGKTILVALAVCAVWSLLVSTAAVTLKPIQDQNKKIEKMRNIIDVGGLQELDKDIEDIYWDRIDSRIVELETGTFLPKEKQVGLLNPDVYEIKKIAKDSELGRSIPQSRDRARIRRMPKFIPVYFVKKDQKVDRIILPVYGSGLWSTMYGFIALDRDLRTIEGFTVYEHGETPGLGGEVDNSGWKSLWKGKLAFDENNRLQVEVIKGKVDTSKLESKYQVDGLSGSTLTTNGVNNLVRFWLGEDGFGIFIQKLRRGGLDGKVQ
jgi:Na+-transporting NADH:ubiquinone oxidoreductase subunit C